MFEGVKTNGRGLVPHAEPKGPRAEPQDQAKAPGMVSPENIGTWQGLITSQARANQKERPELTYKEARAMAVSELAGLWGMTAQELNCQIASALGRLPRRPRTPKAAPAQAVFAPLVGAQVIPLVSAEVLPDEPQPPSLAGLLRDELKRLKLKVGQRAQVVWVDESTAKKAQKSVYQVAKALGWKGAESKAEGARLIVKRL